MNHSDLASAALLRQRATAPKPTDTATDEPSLSGASFLEHEPDLIKEAGMNARQASAWAAGGHPAAE